MEAAYSNIRETKTFTLDIPDGAKWKLNKLRDSLKSKFFDDIDISSSIVIGENASMRITCTSEKFEEIKQFVKEYNNMRGYQ